MAHQRYLGIIEGFYGKPWSWQARLDYPGFMQETGLDTYIYAPKSDNCLRKDWRQPWTEPFLERLIDCAGSFASSGISFGIGLSPLGLAGAGNTVDFGLLTEKLQQIVSVSDALLCILFDDVPSTGSNMASSQLKLCEKIRAVANPRRMIVCPSYYSTDPVLEKLFGARPPRYWQEFGIGLDDDVDIFWTGERVCSDDYSEDNLDFIANQFRRLPVLWDNYPVNDGEKSSRYLHLQPFSGRQSFLASYTAGHIANPMNQPYLSQLPLATLSSIYNGKSTSEGKHQSEQERSQLWQAFIGKHLAGFGGELVDDVTLFSSRGLDALGDQDRQRYADKYRQFDSVYTREIVAWLEGDYEFDPACLTG